LKEEKKNNLEPEWKNTIVETSKLLDLVQIINKSCCSNKFLYVSKANEIGVTSSLLINCKNCNFQTLWQGSNTVEGKVLQVNKSVSTAGQLSNMSYSQFYRFLGLSGVKPLSKPKFHEDSVKIWEKSSDLATKVLHKNIEYCINGDLFILYKIINSTFNLKHTKYLPFEVLSIIHTFLFGLLFLLDIILDGRYGSKLNSSECTVVCLHPFYNKILFRSNVLKQRVGEEIKVKIKIDTKVLMKEKKYNGLVKYVGIVNEESGTMVGVEWKEEIGNSNGTLNGIECFKTKKNFSSFFNISTFEKLTSIKNIEIDSEYIFYFQKQREGIIKYLGTINKKEYVAVEFLDGNGENNGLFQNKKYFNTKEDKNTSIFYKIKDFKNMFYILDNNSAITVNDCSSNLEQHGVENCLLQLKYYKFYGKPLKLRYYIHDNDGKARTTISTLEPESFEKLDISHCGI
jgi:hypothetical protein